MRLRSGWILVALPLMAGESLRIAAVERKGWPPFEDDRRVYRIEGEDVASLRVGERLQLQRPGEASNPGCLTVARVAGAFAEAYLDQRGSTSPLKGDWAEPKRAKPLPRLPPLRAAEDLRPATPVLPPPPEPPVAQPQPAKWPSPVPSVEHAQHESKPPLPHFQEAIYFLEGGGSLSPKGKEKLLRAVESWGAGGHWVLGLPQDRLLPEKVRQNRIYALRSALRALGVTQIDIRAVDLVPGDHGSVVYAGKD